MYELPISNLSVQTESNNDFTPIGTAITAAEVAERLSVNLYNQLSEKDDNTTLLAVQRAEVYAGAIFRRLHVEYNLDIHTQREIVLLLTVYEMHIALGHEEAGREYRTKAKDIILAAYGDYPDSDDKSASKSSGATVVTPRPAGHGRPSRYQRAFAVGDRHGRY